MADAASLGSGLHQRLLALIASSGALLGSPRLEDVLGATLKLSRDLVSADGYAVWRLDQLVRQCREKLVLRLIRRPRPLNAMIGYAQMLRTGAMATARQSAALDVIERNGARLAQIVEEILDVSRIISGKLRLTLGVVSVPQLIADAVATVTPAAQAKNIPIEACVEGIATVHGDYDRLQQVLWNVLTNAVKFTANGGHVKIAVEPAGADVEIVVMDNGRGIDASFVPHVFERAGVGDGATFRLRLPLSTAASR